MYIYIYIYIHIYIYIYIYIYREIYRERERERALWVNCHLNHAKMKTTVTSHYHLSSYRVLCTKINCQMASRGSLFLNNIGF